MKPRTEEAVVVRGYVARSRLIRQVGERIVRARERKGWTRVELARALGVSRESLGQWERGMSRAPFEVLVALKRLLGVTTDELLTGEPPAEAGLGEEEWSRAAEHLEELTRILRSRGSATGKAEEAAAEDEGDEDDF
jgi:transcriptional regulator with XRE-family HTH domain